MKTGTDSRGFFEGEIHSELLFRMSVQPLPGFKFAVDFEISDRWPGTGRRYWEGMTTYRALESTKITGQLQVAGSKASEKQRPRCVERSGKLD